MYERIFQTNEYIRGKYPWLSEKEAWIVLSKDLREVVFVGETFEVCRRWLSSNCENCEE